VAKKLKMPTLYTIGKKVEDIKIMQKLLKRQHYAQVGKRLKLSTLYTRG
jgi:hypothetical protein